MNSYDKITEDEDLIIFSPIFIFRRNKIKLSKNNKYSNLQIKFHKKLISSNNENDVEILENRIKNFLTVMNSKCKNFNSTVFYKNFRKTWFNLKKLNSRVISGVDGSVKISTFVNIFELKRLSASYHELLHLSSLKDTIFVYKPFNEGYTQLLEKRYFNEAGPSYYFEVEVMKIIELIFGQEELEKLYFSGNFDDLCYLFENKNSGTNLDFFYTYLDYIFKIEKNNKIIEQKEFFQKCLNSVFETLLYCFLNNASTAVLDHIGLFKNFFSFSIKFEKDNQKHIISSIEENKFYEIVTQFKNNQNKVY